MAGARAVFQIGRNSCIPLAGVRMLGSKAWEPTAAHKELVQRLKDPTLLKSQSFIGGSWVDASDEERIDVHDPATGETLASVSHCKGSETRAAIAEASSVFKSWAAKTGKERSQILRKWFELVRDNQEDITTLMTLECGKPLAQSKGEFESGISTMEWCAEEAKRVDGDVICTPAASKRFLVVRQPVGVVGAITPWNFPFSMITRKVSPALAAGCTVVLKPSELTPLTALALAELADRAGMPRGVLNIVVGDAKSIGDELVKSDDVRKIAFTGSTRVGKLLMAGSAATMKKVSMELGGNAPFIVFQDADLAQAAAAVTTSSYRNAGQTCICTNRVFVHESVHDDFVKELVEAVQKLRVGAGMDAATTHGPLIQHSAVETVEAKVQDAISKGATVAVGGKRPEYDASHPLSKGSFYEPTVLTGGDHRHALLPRGDVWPRNPGVQVLYRRGGHPDGKHHRVRPGCLLLHQGPGQGMEDGRGPGVWDGGCERGGHHLGCCPLRRGQALRPGQGGVQVCTGRLPGHEDRVHGPGVLRGGAR
ncbi:ALDH5 [Auxenochlorella protothecoides x Auxenochlorella symbiontica]